MGIKFKVGDKVKAVGRLKCNFEEIGLKNIVGVVTKIGSVSIKVKWNTNKCILCGDKSCLAGVQEWSYPPLCLKPSVKPGEQLMLFEL